MIKARHVCLDLASRAFGAPGWLFLVSNWRLPNMVSPSKTRRQYRVKVASGLILAWPVVNT